MTDSAHDTRLTFIATCDLVAIPRGRSLRSVEFERRRKTGVGWVPADLAITTFGGIADPNEFGSLGDTRLIPDGTSALLPALGGRPETEVVMASISSPDGTPWGPDPRGALASAIRALDATGLRLQVAFEQEFGLVARDGRVGPAGAGFPAPPPFSLEAHRFAEPFGSDLVATLHAAGLEPETWLPEFGIGQFEITVAPAPPLVAADRAILVRAAVRDVATAYGFRATFAPLVRPDAVGNGVHVHLSLWEPDGRPVTVSPDGELTTVGGRFAAGLLAHAPALVAWTAPSVISPIRFGPHRWSSAAAFVGREDREAMVRICPMLTIAGDGLTSANIEYRAADATANPWLVLAALIRAGLDGIERELPTPPVLRAGLDGLDGFARSRLGVAAIPPTTEDALAAIENDASFPAWFDGALVRTHLAIRRAELAALAGVSIEERCTRYADVI